MSSQPFMYLFYSDFLQGHRHKYIHKDTYEPIDDNGPWPQTFHVFYFSENCKEKPSWFIDGEWSKEDGHPKGFARFRDNARSGWHVVKTGTRFVRFEDRRRFFNFNDSKHPIDLWSLNTPPKDPSQDRSLSDILEAKLVTARLDCQVQTEKLSNLLDDELIKAFTLDQRHERAKTNIDPAFKQRASIAWSNRLREKVRTSEEARKEAERMRVVCQGDWLDD